MGCNTSKNAPIEAQTPRASSVMPLQPPTDPTDLPAATEQTECTCMDFGWNSTFTRSTILNIPLILSYIEHFPKKVCIL